MIWWRGNGNFILPCIGIPYLVVENFLPFSFIHKGSVSLAVGALLVFFLSPHMVAGSSLFSISAHKWPWVLLVLAFVTFIVERTN